MKLRYNKDKARARSVIFDLDGTLIDSLPSIAVSMNRLLEKKGFPVHDPMTYKDFIGDGVEKLVERALPGSGLSDINSFIDEYIAIYTQSWEENTRAFEGIQVMLRTLREEGVNLYILSNKRDELTRIQALEIFPDIVFKQVSGARSGIPKKPDPSAALAMLTKHGGDPGETVFIGDSGVDMQTAVRGGMTPGGVLWGYSDKNELLEAGAEFLLRHPDEITRYILWNPVRS